MKLIFGFLATVASIYSLLIFIRIILSWFGGIFSGTPVRLLASITDPYLDWWRNRINLTIGFLDFSAVVGIAALGIVQRILYTLSISEVITLGSILAVILMSAWSIASFILGFCIVILILRLIAYLTNRDIYSQFWSIIDSISQPILYKLNRIFLGRRIGSYLNGMFRSIIVLAVIMVGGSIAVPILAELLYRLPI